MFMAKIPPPPLGVEVEVAVDPGDLEAHLVLPGALPIKILHPLLLIRGPPHPIPPLEAVAHAAATLEEAAVGDEVVIPVAGAAPPRCQMAPMDPLSPATRVEKPSH